MATVLKSDLDPDPNSGHATMADSVSQGLRTVSDLKKALDTIIVDMPPDQQKLSKLPSEQRRASFGWGWWGPRGWEPSWGRRGVSFELTFSF